MPKVSIIVPFYNVEKYIEKCLQTLVNQTLEDIEIILVNDGSQDGTEEIAKKYQEQYPQKIKYLEKENGGLSDARNVGMEVATGEYVSFIDSDDYISLDFYETLLETIVDNDSDIVECGVVKFYENRKFDEYSDDLKVTNYDTLDGLEGLINENPFKQHVWNKLYKTNIALDIPYAVGKLNEDEFWTYQIFGKAKKVTRINKTMYYYFQRGSSIMGNGYNIRRLDALEGKMNRQAYIEKNFPTLATKAKVDLYGSCIFAYQSVLKFMSGKDKKKAIKIIKDYKNRCKLTTDEINSITDSSRKYYKLAKFNFYLCCKMKAIFNIGF